MRRSELGEPPPARWEDCLYLEWFSQNGRVVIELPMSKIRFLSEHEIAARDRADKESFEAEMREMEERRQRESASAGTDELIDELIDEEDIDFSSHDNISETQENDGDEYRLIPDELRSELERKSRRTDRAVAGDSEETIKMLEETELMDDLMERGKRTPLKEFLADLNLPSPETVLTDEDADQVLKLALMKLALGGVAYHTCEHCSVREAYRIFIEEICEKSGAFPQLRGTGWVQNVCASDFCKKCLGDDPK
jgi:hypothetical protein